VDEIRATLTHEGYESVPQHMAGTGLARPTAWYHCSRKGPGSLDPGQYINDFGVECVAVSNDLG
jgi:hypothetical protein